MVRALRNALTQNRLHHAWLMTGTRGVGKTTLARVMAKALNCETGVTADPCGKCSTCTEIDAGRFVDLIELDAASNTQVDQMRELLENALYAPTRARFKVYIIDEVHMLSRSAFNAMLKTLEEPPEHVKFILATTDPQKVPATIQSRCLRFDFRSISADQIARHLEDILRREKVGAEPAVIRRVARLANGSMRDALSLLDQLLSMGSDKLTLSMIDDVLPMPRDEVLTRLIERLAEHDAAGALDCLDQSLSAGYSLERFSEALGDQVRTLMLLAVCGPDTPLVELPTGAAEAMAALSQRFDAEQYVHMIAVLEELRRNVRFSALGRALTEAALVRLASATRYRSIQSLLEALGADGGEDGAKKKVSLPPAGPSAAAPARPAPAAPPARMQPAPTAASGAARPAPARPAAPLPVTTTPASGEDLKAASTDPAVRQAMELFGGSLVNVERVT
ncbi:MAG: hypothetical protein AMXMBFR83_21210 [Phycisphaerae bacterium]